MVQVERINVDVKSEIGELEAVILHRPGREVENMIPDNAERALYSDILNLSVATSEYAQFEGTIKKHAKVFYVTDLLADVLTNERVKDNLVREICKNEKVSQIQNFLFTLDSKELARQLIEGVLLKKTNLTSYLNKNRYVLQPLHNFFFTRDASSAINNEVLINKMASRVRMRESIIMQTIFDYNPVFGAKTINPLRDEEDITNISMEGGDILIAREDILLIGMSCRTTSQGIDYIIEKVKEKYEKKHIIIQELPHTPESFIHLDMVFTFIDKDKCMVYEPLILKRNKYQTIHITIDDGKVLSIDKEKNLIEALHGLGVSITPIKCGGDDTWNQEREQWHSGTNFFALAPGKVIGYSRNTNTIESLNKSGLEVIKAKDIIDDKVDLSAYSKYVITIDGSELARGGGGARCMTMPVRRKAVDW